MTFSLTVHKQPSGLSTALSFASALTFQLSGGKRTLWAFPLGWIVAGGVATLIVHSRFSATAQLVTTPQIASASITYTLILTILLGIYCGLFDIIAGSRNATLLAFPNKRGVQAFRLILASGASAVFGIGASLTASVLGRILLPDETTPVAANVLASVIFRCGLYSLLFTVFCAAAAMLIRSLWGAVFGLSCGILLIVPVLRGFANWFDYVPGIAGLSFMTATNLGHSRELMGFLAMTGWAVTAVVAALVCSDWVWNMKSAQAFRRLKR